MTFIASNSRAVGSSQFRGYPSTTYISFAMKLPIRRIAIVLLLLAAPVHAQDSNPFQFLIDALLSVGGFVGDVAAGAVDIVTGALGDLMTGISSIVDTAVLGVAEAIIGDDPEVLACNAIEDALAGQQVVTCSNCVADIGVLTTDAVISGGCSVADTCVTTELCGGCGVSYTGNGDVNVFDQSFDGLATLEGECTISAGSLAASVSKFTFQAGVDLNGALTDLNNIQFDVGSCTAALLDSNGAGVGSCTCSTVGCAAMEISFNCGVIAGQAVNSNGCISFTSFGAN